MEKGETNENLSLSYDNFGDGVVRLIKELDGRTVLAEKDFVCNWDTDYPLCLEVTDATLIASVNGDVVFEHTDTDRPLLSGSVALVCSGGRVDFGTVSVRGRQ